LNDFSQTTQKEMSQVDSQSQWVNQKTINHILVGGFIPFEKYARQIGSFP